MVKTFLYFYQNDCSGAANGSGILNCLYISQKMECSFTFWHLMNYLDVLPWDLVSKMNRFTML